VKTSEACEEHSQQTQRILRQIGLGGQILSDLGIRRIRLLTNTPTHIPALQGFGIEIVEQVKVPLDAAATTTSR
jgi:3,4-dihydroxy 2-butanone 4-phosphate synthase/GTP cyclohydrolase II